MLFTERLSASFVKLNLTPSFLSNDTEATRSTEPRNDFTKSLEQKIYTELDRLN